MAFLTILGQTREARARSGHRGPESAGNRRNQTPRSDPRVDARGQADVRPTFARSVDRSGNDVGEFKFALRVRLSARFRLGFQARASRRRHGCRLAP